MEFLLYLTVFICIQALTRLSKTGSHVFVADSSPQTKHAGVWGAPPSFTYEAVVYSSVILQPKSPLQIMSVALY